MYCKLCHMADREAPFNRSVVGICRELNLPVCAKHAEGCEADGHGFDPLPVE